MQKSIYETANFFLARTALLPHKQIEITADELFEFYKYTPLFQEAIAVASCSLYESLSRHIDNKQEREKLFPSLLKYFLRMSSRATPFGLFSAIGWGEFSESSELYFPYSSLDKKAHPDAAWSKSLIDALHNEIESVRKLKVMTNPNLLKKSGRVYLNAENEKTAALDSISIRSTMVSDFVFFCSKSPILYQELEKKLLKKFDEHPKEVVSEYLWQVFKKGYLISECSFSLRHPFSLQDFSKKSKSDELDALITAFENYENSEFGKGDAKLNEIVQKSGKKKSVKHPVQVNAYRKEGVFKLPNSIRERISETVSLLWLFSNEDSQPLLDYQRKFHEKYGSNRLVPVLELLDPHRGLGLHTIASENKKRSSFPSWKNAIFSDLKNKVIRLEEFPAAKPSQEEIQRAPLSFEIYFELLAGSEKELEAGNYTLLVNPAGGSRQAGCTFGRFSYLCSEDQKQQLRQFMQKEEALRPQAQFIEASFLPDSPRLANVAFHEKIRSFQLEMHYHEENSHSIELEDIYVGSTPDRLYLFSKKLKKELVVTMSSALNPNFAPSVLKFLLDVSKSSRSSFSTSIWNGADQEPYLPRFCYKNVVLSPARWSFNMSQLGLAEKHSANDVEKALENYLISAEVPDRIYLTHLDNRLSLNWKNKSHFKLMLQQLTTEKRLLLFEVIGSEKDFPVNSELGRHVTEFVVPCVKKDVYKSEVPTIFYPECAQLHPLDRQKIIGSDWLYCKFALSNDCEATLLKNYLVPFLHGCLENHLIDKWFYVRYKDTTPHLRVRLHGMQEKLFQSVLPLLSKQIAKWISEGTLGDFSTHTYEREVERYGGPECVELAETLFYVDSECCAHSISELNSYGFPPYIVGALGIINIVQGFYSSIEEQIAFFKPFLRRSELLAGVREHSSRAVQIASGLFYEAELPEAWHGLKSYFHKTQEIAKDMKTKLDQPSEMRWNTKENVVQSILHMHCNRLFGIDIDLEAKAHVMAHHLLEKLQFKNKKPLETALLSKKS